MRFTAEFEVFVLEVEPRLRRALVSRLGVDRGRDATAEALAYAWEHWSAVQAMGNPVGYLYRVGVSKVRERKQPVLFPPVPVTQPEVSPELPEALRALTAAQRVAVVLVHAYGWTAAEVAELEGVSVTTIQTHVERGLRNLRRALEVNSDG